MKLSKNISVLALSLAVLLATGCASTRTQSSIGESIDDTVITTKVKASIFNDPELSSSEINVETFKGVVQLSGFVSESSDIARAGALASDVAGVTSVKNDIVTK